MLKIEERPRGRVETWAEDSLVECVVGSAGDAGGEIHVEFELVDVQKAIYVVDIVMEKFGRRCGRYDGFELGWVAHRHLKCIEAAPRDTEHADVAIRPWLDSEPVNDLFGVELFLLGVLAIGGDALARAESTDVDPRADIATMGEISVLGVVSGGGAVI